MITLTGLPIDCPDHDNNTVLHIAAANDHEALVSYLLENQTNFETTNSMGWTPLMQAARHGHMQVVIVLLQAGATVDRCNRLGEESYVSLLQDNEGLLNLLFMQMVNSIMKK